MPLTSPNLGAVTVGDTTVTPSGMSHAGVTGIGHGSTYGSTSVIRSLTDGGIPTGAIGYDQDTQTLKAVSTPDVSVGANAGLRYMEIASDVVDNAVIETGWVNRSGRTLLAGETAFAVEG